VASAEASSLTTSRVRPVEGRGRRGGGRGARRRQRRRVGLLPLGAERGRREAAHHVDELLREGAALERRARQRHRRIMVTCIERRADVNYVLVSVRLLLARTA